MLYSLLTKCTWLPDSSPIFDSYTTVVTNPNIAKLKKVDYSFKFGEGEVTVKSKPETFGLEVNYIFKEKTYLPLIIYTIVANGWPFITYHLDVLKSLERYYQWHIIEGIAIGRANSKNPYSRANFSEEFVYRGLSVDGTTTYINKLKKENPENIFVHRPVYGDYWRDKKVMIYVTHVIDFSCVMIEIDVDELWSREQLLKIQELFQEGSRRCMFFHCHYFITPSYVTITRNKPTHANSYEWLRAWKYDKGDFWTSHAPPYLWHYKSSSSKWVKDFGFKCFRHGFTEANGLVFTHYSYTVDSAMKFKEEFYGRPGLYDKWKAVENHPGPFPLEVSDYFSWLKKGTYVDKPENDNFGKNVPLIPYPQPTWDKTMEKKWVLEYNDAYNPNTNKHDLHAIIDLSSYYKYPNEKLVIEFIHNILKNFPTNIQISILFQLNYEHTIISPFVTVWDKNGDQYILVEQENTILGYIKILTIEPKSDEKHRLNVIRLYNPNVVFVTATPYDFKFNQIVLSLTKEKIVINEKNDKSYYYIYYYYYL